MVSPSFFPWPQMYPSIFPLCTHRATSLPPPQIKRAAAAVSHCYRRNVPQFQLPGKFGSLNSTTVQKGAAAAQFFSHFPPPLSHLVVFLSPYFSLTAHARNGDRKCAQKRSESNNNNNTPPPPPPPPWLLLNAPSPLFFPHVWLTEQARLLLLLLLLFLPSPCVGPPKVERERRRGEGH